MRVCSKKVKDRQDRKIYFMVKVLYGKDFIIKKSEPRVHRTDSRDLDRVCIRVEKAKGQKTLNYGTNIKGFLPFSSIKSKKPLI